METVVDFDRYRRRNERKDYQTEVSFSTDSMCFPAMLENVSMGGALLATSKLPLMRTGSEITVTIPFAVKEGCVKKRGTVMWAVDGQFGILFL